MIPGQSSASITWEDTVLASVLTNCSTDSIYDIAFSVAASGVGQTACKNGTYVCPVMVDCQQTADTFSSIPIFTVISRTGSYDSSICNARCIQAQATDPRFCVSCFVKSVSAIELQNMTFSIKDSASWTFEVCVIDSMKNGSATILALDETGIMDTAQYEYCTIPDTHAPLVQEGICLDSSICFYQVSDIQAWDRGLSTIYFSNVKGVAINPPDSIYGLGLVTFSVSGIGSFCITAIDLAGNRFDTCFGSRESISTSPPQQLSLSIYPNPSFGDVSIFIEGTPSADVEIFDVLGHEVDRFRVEGSYDWQTAALPTGTYIVRAIVNSQTEGSQIITKYFMKE